MKIFKAALAGLVAGVLLSMLAGGCSSLVFGKPFVGTRGSDAFYSGLFFPGLIVFAPGGAAVGAAAGVVASEVVAAWRRSRRGDPPAP